MAEERCKVNVRKYKQVSDTIVEAYRSKDGFFTPLNDGRPEMSIFSRIERKDDRSAFLAAFFFSLFLRGTISTNQAVDGFVKMVEENDWLEPKVASKLSEKELHQALIEAKFGYAAADIAKYWIGNARALLPFEAEPWRCLEGVESYHVALHVLGGPRTYGWKKSRSVLPYLGFDGLGHTGKVAALFLQMLMDRGLIERFPLPVAADFHFVQIYLATMAIDPGSVTTYYTLSGRLRDASLELCPKNDPHYNSDLSAAVYAIGSNLCKWHPQMTANPIRTDRRRKDSKRFVPIEELLAKPCRDRKLGRCSRGCPVERWCKLIIPSGPYHERGNLGTPENLLKALGDKDLL